VAVTATSIGVEVAQNPANQTPHAKLGYQRQEIALVPTNRSAKEDAGDGVGGAASHGEVLMELRYGGVFDLGPSSGIYQRLAVGQTAVQQAGASLMFSRDADGAISEPARQALEHLKVIPSSSSDVRAQYRKVASARECHKDEVDKIIERAGAGTFDLILDGKTTTAQMEQILAAIGNLAPCS
jgi:hypothetical protein